MTAARRKRVAPVVVREPSPQEAAPPGPAQRAARGPGLLVSDRSWEILAAVILVLGIALRLWDLPLMPFHHDEGIHGWFTTTLLRQGTWTYDLVYHGPSIYYLGLVSAILFGLNDTAMRLIPAAFGVATVALALGMRRWIGPIGALAAAALLAISPGWLYYSRYFRQEALFVCFTIALVYFAWRWSEERRTAFLLLASASLALMVATKETAVIAVPILLISAAGVRVYPRLREDDGVFEDAGGATGRSPRKGGAAASRSGPKRAVRAARTSQQTLDERVLSALGRGELVLPLPLLGAVAVFLVIHVTLFSSFFANPTGVLDSLSALTVWASTSGITHVEPITAYVFWAFREELPVILLAFLGGFTAVLGGRSRFALFTSLWAAGTFAAYSLISYKEPWLMLNFIVPMTILGGYGIQRLWDIWEGRRVLVAAALAIALVVSGYAGIQLTFFDYDSESNAYVYVQTTRDVYDMMAAVDAAGAKVGTGADTHVVVMSPDYWPMPWYWRDHPNVGFFGQVVGTTDPIAIVKVEQEATLPADFLAAYARQAQYTLRPGIELVLYLRRDAFGL